MFPSSDVSASGAGQGAGAESRAPSLGANVRRARKAAGLSMKALAERVEVSQPFISQVENGRATPSLSTLNRLARALGVAPGDLMPREASDEVRVTRAADGALVPTSDHPRSAVGRVIAPGRDAGIEFIEYRVDPSEHLDDWFEFPGELVVYVVEGQLEVEIEGRGVWTLGERDSMHHDSAMRHRWRPVGDRPAFLLFAASRRSGGGGELSTRTEPTE